MTDDPHDDVRARLAAEPTPRMPDDVAVRLHEALAAESQSRTAPEAGEQAASVTSPPRRGRWKAPLLAAAGVVAVVAIGIPVINQTSDQASEDGASSGGNSFSSDSDGAQEAPKESATSGDQATPEDRPESLRQQFRSDPMTLHRESFAAEAADYLDSRSIRDSLPAVSPGGISGVSCAGPRPTAAGGLRATLDGEPAVVITADTQSGGVRVQAVVCGEDGPTVGARMTLD